MTALFVTVVASGRDRGGLMRLVFVIPSLDNSGEIQLRSTLTARKVSTSHSGILENCLCKLLTRLYSGVGDLSMFGTLALTTSHQSWNQGLGRKRKKIKRSLIFISNTAHIVSY